MLEKRPSLGEGGNSGIGWLKSSRSSGVKGRSVIGRRSGGMISSGSSPPDGPVLVGGFGGRGGVPAPAARL